MRKRWIGWGAVVLATGGGVAVLIQSGMTAVASVRVQGAEQLDPVALRRASGISPGMNALTLDLEAAAARLEQVPLVEDANVARDGAFDIVITIRERQPQLLVITPFARRAVDADAVAMTLPPDPVVLPVLRLQRLSELEPSTVRAVLRLWDRLHVDERARIRLEWGPVNGLSAQLGRTTLRLGSGEELQAKLDAFRSLRRALGGMPRRVDLSQLPRVAVS